MWGRHTPSDKSVAVISSPANIEENNSGVLRALGCCSLDEIAFVIMEDFLELFKVKTEV